MSIPKPSAALLASDLVRHGRILTPVSVNPSRRRQWRSLDGWTPPYDPTAAANNARRLQRLQEDYESGRRNDRPRDIEDHGQHMDDDA